MEKAVLLNGTILTDNLHHYLEVAQEAVLMAGVVLKEHFGKLSPSIIDEKTKNDFVTNVDKKSEELIRSHFMYHDVLAEESSAERRASPFLWIIDPLDSTFLCAFAVKIAHSRRGINPRATA